MQHQDKSTTNKAMAELSAEAKIERVLAILSYPLTSSHMSVAAATGFDREIVRRIRLGIKFSDILPELPRMDPEVSRARCNQCVQWKPADKVEADRYGECTLGIPECKTDGTKWARGCGAFTPVEKKNDN